MDSKTYTNWMLQTKEIVEKLEKESQKKPAWLRDGYASAIEIIKQMREVGHE